MFSHRWSSAQRFLHKIWTWPWKGNFSVWIYIYIYIEREIFEYKQLASASMHCYVSCFFEQEAAVFGKKNISCLWQAFHNFSVLLQSLPSKSVFVQAAANGRSSILAADQCTDAYLFDKLCPCRACRGIHSKWEANGPKTRTYHNRVPARWRTAGQQSGTGWSRLVHRQDGLPSEGPCLLPSKASSKHVLILCKHERATFEEKRWRKKNSRTCLAWNGFTRTKRRRSTGQQPGTRSASRPGDEPRINRTWTARQPLILFPHSV